MVSLSDGVAFGGGIQARVERTRDRPHRVAGGLQHHDHVAIDPCQPVDDQRRQRGQFGVQPSVRDALSPQQRRNIDPKIAQQPLDDGGRPDRFPGQRHTADGREFVRLDPDVQERRVSSVVPQPIRQPVIQPADMQIDRLDAAEGPFRQCRGFVAAHGIHIAERRLGQAAAHEMEAVGPAVLAISLAQKRGGR